MFKVIESDITKSGRALSILNRDMALFVKNWNNTQGLKNRLQSAFTNPNVITQHDLTQINEYNKAISAGVSKQTAFYRCLGDSSIAVQNLAANARYGTINTEGLVVVTEELTLAQRASAVATQALVKGLNLIGNIAFAMAINAIITKVMELVNKEKELCDSAKESANEIKSQADEMKKLASEYEAIIDSEKSEAEKTEELNEWKQNLVETYGFEKDKLEELNTERERGIELLKEEIDAVNQRERGIWLAENSTQFSTAKEKITNPSSSSNSRLLDGSVNSDIFTKINQNNIRDSIKNKFNSISTIGNSTFFDFKGENLIETYDNLQNLLSALGNAKNLSDDEKRLLSELKKEEKAIKKVLDDYQVIYETGYKYLAQNNFDDFAKDNPLDNVGKENYLSWRKGLLDTAQGDKELSSELESLIENQFPDLTKYFSNLDKAYSMFGIDNIINDANEGMKKAFINALSDEDIEIATKIPDLFDEGLDGATKKIEAWKKQNPIETDVKINIDEALEGQTNKIKAITSAMEDMSETGYITSETYAELAKLGGNFTDCLEWENGKLKLNVDKLKDLEIQQLATAKSANALAISELELKAASLAAHGQDFSDIQAQIESLMKESAVFTQLQEEIRNAKPDDKKTKSEEPESVTQFKKALAEKEHLLNTNQITEQEYYDWLDDESKRVYGNLADYEEDLWKYEEQVYKWRQEQEQDLFDKKIENYKKLSDKALDDKIADFNVVDPKALDNLKKFNEEMQKAYGLGNVDLTKRPKVNSDTMRKAGYEVDDGGTATVYSSFDFLWQGDEENGKYVAVHYTPILPDGTVLDEKTLSDYLYGTLEGSQDILSADNLGVVLKVDTDLNISDKDVKSLETDKPTQNIQDIIKACDEWDIALHNVQEQWVELDNEANKSTTSYANKFDYAREQINSAITETQNRINELSLKTGFEDEISDLKSDLEDLSDTLKDISEKEYNFNISLIDDDIDDLDRKYEKTLDPQYLDDIERLYADKKTATQNRINELISQGYSIESEEIRNLYNDLEDIEDKIDETFERKIDAEKEYINKLKDDYSDMIDSRIDEYKKLSDTIEDSYDKQIKAIDKQIKALDKKNEQEERQTDILEKQKSVREAQLALEKASIKNRYVYVGGGYEARADEEAVAKAEEDLQKAKDDLQKAYQEDVKSKLEEQKEILETQKSDSKDYYDKIVSDLETQKSAREKQYDILVDIYDEISGGKSPTSSNESLIEKLNNSVDIKEAIESLSPEEIKQAVASGLLVADSNGDYAIDYSVLNKNEEAVKDNTAELAKLNSKLDESTQTNSNTNVNPNLDGEGYLVGSDGKRILSNGKPIKTLSKSEWEKRHTTDEWSPKGKDVEKMTMEEYYKKLQNGKSNNTNTSKKSFAGYDTMKGFLNAVMTGAFTIPIDTANRMMNSNINSRIGENISKIPEYTNNVVNSTPNINITNNIDGNPDQKTIDTMNKNIESALIKYTDQLAAQAKNIFFKKMYS